MHRTFPFDPNPCLLERLILPPAEPLAASDSEVGARTLLMLRASFRNTWSDSSLRRGRKLQHPEYSYRTCVRVSIRVSTRPMLTLKLTGPPTASAQILVSSTECDTRARPLGESVLPSGKPRLSSTWMLHTRVLTLACTAISYLLSSVRKRRPSSITALQDAEHHLQLRFDSTVRRQTVCLLYWIRPWL